MLFSNFKLSSGAEHGTVVEKLNLQQYNDIVDSFLKSVASEKGAGFDEKLQNHLLSCMKTWKETDKHFESLCIGLAPLFLFIQKNWIGPDMALSESLLQIINENSEVKSKVLKELVLDGENIVSVVEFPELLYLSRITLETVYNIYTESQLVKIWFLRCLFIHQQVLEELSPILFDKLCGIIAEIQNTFESLPKALKIALHLEFGRIYMFYYNVQKSRVEIRKATELSGIDISLSGALGKRTKFQCENLAQLIVKVNIDDNEYISEDSEDEVCSFPTDLKLNDEVRLDKIKFADDSSNNYPELSGLQQALLLANLFQTEKSQPKDSLADEELQPYIQCILDQPKVWSIRTSTLLLRSKLEANHKRTVERSMMQFQLLVDGFKDTTVSLVQKSSYFFISYLPPKWEVHLRLANVLVSMGSLKSALEMYLGLEDWENVIHCYNALQMRHKAQEIITQELDKNPSPKLWCLLGDATDDTSCYEKAWELSNKRSARAQRHWALFYYYRQKYKESIEHFQKSLEINSLQKEMWYRLGYAALMEEMWETSAIAYRRYVVLDPDCFEAWNNLGRCYCELKQKQRAWRALQEALKVDYSNWKVWDNYMVVSSDLRMFDDVIKSYHEILNIKGKHLDIAVLNSLVIGYKNVEVQESDNEKKELRNKFKSKLLELFGRLTSQIISDPELWFLYSEVVDGDSSENLTKKHQLLLKSHRSAINKVGWEKKLDNCNRIIYVLSKLVEVGLNIRSPDVLMSCKLAATGALTKIKKEYPDVDFCENLEKNLEELENILNT